MSPNPLKVGDQPQFTLTYQNISDKPIYAYSGCSVGPLGVMIYPPDAVSAGFPSEHLPKCPDGPVLIEPNQTETDVGGPDLTGSDLHNFSRVSIGRRMRQKDHAV